MATVDIEHEPRCRVQVGPVRAGEAIASREGWYTLFAGAIVALFGLALLVKDPQWFWQDDYQSYQLANYRDVARAWLDGEVPLLSPYSWHGGALAGEYQNGVFSVVLTGLALATFNLSLTAAATTFSIVHLVILATGTFRLGRRRGLDIDLALLAAIVTTLSGWIMIWGAKAWFPALASFAWLPWFWWAIERSLVTRGPARFLPAGVFLYLIITAGWPFTVLMAGLLSAWVVLRQRVTNGAWLPTWTLVGSWIVGMGLSAPAWKMLLEYTRETIRGQTPPSLFNDHWVVPFNALLGLVFPGLCTGWNVFGLWKPHVSAELAGGLVPLAAIVAGFAAAGRRTLRGQGWEVALCVVALGLALAPSVGNFRWSFRWLPLFTLLLSLIGAEVIGRFRTTATRFRPGTWACFLVVLAWGLALLVGFDTTSQTLWHGAALTGVCLVWALIETQCPADCVSHKWVPGGVAIVASWLALAGIRPYLEVPVWNESVAEANAFDPQVRYLSLHAWGDLMDGPAQREVRPLNARTDEVAIIPGNFNLYRGVEFVNGYSPMQPCGVAAVFRLGAHGYLGGHGLFIDDDATAAGVRLTIAESGAGDFLSLMGVDGLVITDQFAHTIEPLQRNGWLRKANVPGATILERKSRSQRIHAVTAAVHVDDGNLAREWIDRRKSLNGAWVLTGPASTTIDFDSAATQEFAAAEVSVTQENRGRVEAEVKNPSSDQESLIVFARQWYPGYRATFNGQPVEVNQVNLTLPAVRLPRGASGTLVLEYWPESLVKGIRMLVATLGLMVVICVLAFRVGRPVRVGDLAAEQNS